MKRTILTLGLVALLSLTAVSCSTDDSPVNDDTNASLTIGGGITTPIDNGDRDLPRPPMRP